MSLQVWLPLTKDLRQQGLSSMTVENHNATLNTAGKLGSCYYFNGSQQWLQLSNNLGNFYNNDWSVACWLKPTDSTRSIILSEYSGTGASNVTIELTTARIVRLYWNGSPDISFSTAGALPLNEWTHLVMAKQGRIVKLYFNGELKQTYTNSSDFSTRISACQPRIGDDYRGNSGNSVSYQGYMNDFRLYDHCLSPMEVKEIAKGLVLHYPLNRGEWGQENLLSGNNAKITTWTNYMPDSVILSGDGYDNKYTLIKGIGGWEKIFTDAIAVTSGKTYTLSFDYSVEQDYTGYSGQFGLSICTTSQAKYGADTDVITKVNFGTVKKSKSRTSVTFVANSNTIYLVANGGNISDGQENISFYISYIKLEEGSVATPWCPNSSDIFATTMGLNGTTEYDCSGFCNNGEYYAYDTNGSISYTSDTPKYNVSTHIASANPTQNAASGTRYLYGHCELTNPTQMSVAFWLKPITGGYGGTTSNGQGYFCTTNYEYGNISVGSDYQASAMNHRDGAVNMNDSASTTQCNVTFYPIIGEWHHYVYTYDGQVGRGYKDGVQTATAQFSAVKTLDSFIGVVIGFSKAGGVWRRNDACYSDFRIYATALSADDVKSLYQNSAYIDSSGNVYGAVHSEV